MSFAIQRYYRLKISEKKLEIGKNQDDLQQKSLDLNKLSWVDSNLTPKYKPGHKSEMAKNGIQFLQEEKFSDVGDFIYPIALSFTDGYFTLLWLEREKERQGMAKVLKYLENKGLDASPGHKYVLQTTGNIFVTTIYKILTPEKPTPEEDNAIVEGYVERVVNYQQPVFATQYAVLDKRNATLRFFENPNSDCISEHDLRFARCLVDFRKNINKICIDSKSNEVFEWPLAAKFFAIHSGNMIIQLMVQKQSAYDEWVKGF